MTLSELIFAACAMQESIRTGGSALCGAAGNRQLHIYIINSRIVNDNLALINVLLLHRKIMGNYYLPLISNRV